MPRTTVHFSEVKNAIRKKFAWPGGYTLFGITRDGAAICCGCMRSNFRELCRAKLPGWENTGWKIDAIECSANLESREFCEENSESYALTYCDNCNAILND